MLRDSLVLEQQHIHTDEILLPVDFVLLQQPHAQADEFVLPIDLVLLQHPYYSPFTICLHARRLAHRLLVVFVSPIASFLLHWPLAF